MNIEMRRRQIGQSLVLFVVILPGLLAVCALGLDAGNLYLQRRQMQAAADLAALAGARLLPDASSAIARAQQTATANGYSSTVAVTTPYGGDATRIEVRITHPVPTFFLPILGVPQMDVSARSVARTTAGAVANPYAIYVGLTSCAGIPSDAFKWTGSDSTIIGQVHSNAGIKISSGGNTWTGGTTYKCNNAFVDSGTGNVYSPAPVSVPADMNPPVSHTWEEFCPGTYYHASGKWDLSQNGLWWLGGTKSSKVLMPGVYCADGVSAEIVLSTVGVTATNVTLVSRGVIRLSGGDFRLTPNPSGLGAAMVAFGSGSDAIKSSAGIGASGLLYAPNGEISFTGPASGVYNGSIVARTLSVSGVNFTLIASPSAAAAQQVLQLIE